MTSPHAHLYGAIVVCVWRACVISWYDRNPLKQNLKEKTIRAITTVYKLFGEKKL